MRRTSLLALLAGLVVLTGCGINGKWSLANVEPTAERRDFEFASFTLQKDGTFYAEKVAPRSESVSGTYTYEDRTLTLNEERGPRYTYGADLQGDELELEKYAEGRRVTATFERKPE